MVSTSKFAASRFLEVSWEMAFYISEREGDGAMNFLLKSKTSAVLSLTLSSYYCD